MNKALIVLALAAVTFAEGFLGSIIAAGLTGLDFELIQAAAIGAGGAAISVLINGLGKLHTYLSARA